MVVSETYKQYVQNSPKLQYYEQFDKTIEVEATPLKTMGLVDLLIAILMSLHHKFRETHLLLEHLFLNDLADEKLRQCLVELKELNRLEIYLKVTDLIKLLI